MSPIRDAPVVPERDDQLGRRRPAEGVTQQVITRQAQLEQRDLGEV